MTERMTDERWHEIGAYRSVEMAWDVADQMEVGAELDRARASETALLAALEFLRDIYKARTNGETLITVEAAIAKAKGDEP
jgi:hypothetical protein